MKITKTTLINADLKNVYKLAETYPLFVKQYQKKKILYSDDTITEVEIGYRIFGFEINWKGKGVKSRYQSIDFIQTEGLLKDLRALWVFQASNNKTKFSIELSFPKAPRFNDRICRLLLLFLAVFTIKKISENLKREAEKS